MNANSAPIQTPKELTDADFEDKAPSSSHPRSNTRRKANWKIQIQTRDRKKISGKMINVSANGIQVSIPDNLSNGDTVFIEIDSMHKGQKRFLQAIGEIQYNAISTSGFHTGIKITSATELTSSFLEQYSLSKI